ncbi:MAG: nickel pincer cofactor biosynthesis protein LarC [Spirochaetales bacterium]|nr:nickel pincer cofactor biosynthesis protein LarC [Spirochaetales bacterium]
MKIAYFDCFSGASGDMILGSLMDAGLSLERVKSELAKLKLSHYDLTVQEVSRKGISGSQALVIVQEDHHHHHHRHLSDLKEIIGTSPLLDSVKEKSLAVFNRLAEAEAKVHGIGIEHVHFHEVGAMDAIIDVVGAVAGIEALGVQRIYSSPLHLGTGTVECAHGTLPIPAPATAELVQGKPVYSTGVQGELLTPTGAALLTTLAVDFGPMPPMTLERVGYGAGTVDVAIPNLLRIAIGETGQGFEGYEVESVAVIETAIDDMNPQIYDHLMQKLLGIGVLDVYLVPLHMKKSRPGTQLTVLCRPDAVNRVADIVYAETTTIGLRWRIENRIKLQREIQSVETAYGLVRVKVAKINDRRVNLSPEYEDCKRVAVEQEVPLNEVLNVVRSAAVHSF